mgnify:CR=1 FL=1
MKEIEVEKHREMLVVVSALVDELYSYLADSVAADIIGIGEKIRKNIKGEEAKKNNETDKV